MIYDTTSVNGKYWAFRDWCKLINDTFHEYVDCNVKLFDDKKTELDKLYEECEDDEVGFANIWMSESEVYNYMFIRGALNAGLIYIYSQFEKQIIELAKLVGPEYAPPRGGVITDACDFIKKKSELDFSSCRSSWNYILDFQQIRHACVHHDGTTYEQRHIDAIKRLRRSLKISEHSDGGWEICLTRKNLIDISDKMSYFFGSLIAELEKCENQKNNNLDKIEGDSKLRLNFLK